MVLDRLVVSRVIVAPGMQCANPECETAQAQIVDFTINFLLVCSVGVHPVIITQSIHRREFERSIHYSHINNTDRYSCGSVG